MHPSSHHPEPWVSVQRTLCGLSKRRMCGLLLEMLFCFLVCLICLNFFSLCVCHFLKGPERLDFDHGLSRGARGSSVFLRKLKWGAVGSAIQRRPRRLIKATSHKRLLFSQGFGQGSGIPCCGLALGSRMLSLETWNTLLNDPRLIHQGGRASSIKRRITSRMVGGHLPKSIFCSFPQLVLRGINHYWTYPFFPGGSSKWKPTNLPTPPQSKSTCRRLDP